MHAGSELATKLAAAQATTERISGDLSSNSRVVEHVLSQTERALEPLGEFGFSCMLQLPENDDESATIVRSLKDAKGPSSGANMDHELWEILRPAPIFGGQMLGQQNHLFPKADSALGALFNSIRILLDFYADARPPAQVGRAPNANPPDLMTEIVPAQGMKWLMLAAPDDVFVVELSGNIPMGKWASSGRILSVKDLLRAQAVIQPAFATGSIKDEGQHRLALQKWRALSIYSIVMYTGDGRRWIFDKRHSSTVHVKGVPLFVGKFIGPVRTTAINY